MKFRLPTAFVMMVVAGLLLWFNFDPDIDVILANTPSEISYQALSYGRPFAFCTEYRNLYELMVHRDFTILHTRWNWLYLAIDATIGISAVIASGYVFERVLRKRENKTNPKTDEAVVSSPK